MEQGAEFAKELFGWTLSLVIPGLLGLYTISFWSITVAAQLGEFSKAQSTVGPFLVTFLTCLVIGLELSVLRWVIFERWIGRKYRKILQGLDFSKLKDPDKLKAFQEIVIQYYRYHQAYGGLFVVLPFFISSIVLKKEITEILEIFVIFSGLGLVVVTACGAYDSYKRYALRAQQILS